MFRRQLGRQVGNQFGRRSISFASFAPFGNYLPTSFTSQTSSTLSLTIRTREMIEETYAHMHHVVEEGVQVAAAKNKKPLVIAGECHDNREDFPLEMMLLTILKEPAFNFNDLFVELSNDLAQACVAEVLKSPLKGDLTVYGDLAAYFDRYHREPVNCFNMIDPYVILKDKLKMRIHGMESSYTDYCRFNALGHYCMSTSLGMKMRDKYMVSELVKSNVNAAAFVGVSHLKGIMTNTLLLEHYHPIAFNFAFASLLDDKVLDNHFDNDVPQITHRLKFAMDAKNVTTILPKMSFFAAGQGSLRNVVRHCENKLDQINATQLCFATMI